MLFKKKLLLACAVLLASTGLAPAPDESAQAIAVLAERDRAVHPYTFDIHVNVAMRSFPWLAFRLDGDGRYEGPGRYSVHFAHVPWFGKGFEHINLAPLEPESWPEQYAIAVAERRGDEVVLAMHPKTHGSLKEARATFEPHAGVKTLVWSYNHGGRIALTVTPQELAGSAVPVHEDAEIIMPTVHAFAHADFTNYRVIADGEASRR